jgi:lysophospholipid acyltransferase (LPLAT)-like uncharacterized protein
VRTTADRKVTWASRLGSALLRSLASTWRVRFLTPRVVSDVHAAGGRVIYVLWHGNLLPLLWSHRQRDIAVIISEHRDGEIIARIAMALGFRTVRGSTSRGAARALLHACREIDAGHDLAVTVDGPRGPAGTVAPGSPVIAQRTGAAMVPVAASASRAWRLNSWDRFMIPKPFARVTVAYDHPIRVPAGAARDATEQLEQVRAGIDRARQAATSQ